MKFFNKKTTSYVVLTLIIILGLGAGLRSIDTPIKTIKPKSNEEFAETTVMLVNKTMQAGGSGVILRSLSDASYILTNKHVCEVLVAGGFIIKNRASIAISRVKPFKEHDLCIVEVTKNLGVNTVLAPFPPTVYSDAIISGHPHLLPTIVTRGHFSDFRRIQVMVGLIPCNENTPEKYAMFCAFMGGYPIFKEYDTQVVSATILPGSSGSAVFNSDGEISGVAFASDDQGLSYAYIVPHAYIVAFLVNLNNYQWIVPSDKNKVDKKIRQLFNFKRVPGIPRHAIYIGE